MGLFDGLGDTIGEWYDATVNVVSDMVGLSEKPITNSVYSGGQTSDISNNNVVASGRTILTVYKDRIGGAWSKFILPIPKGFNDTFENKWNDVELGKIAGNMYEGTKGDVAAGFTVGGTEAAATDNSQAEVFEQYSNLKSLRNRASINPHTQLIYKAPAIRQFQFSWTLKPKNLKQAQSINSMIHTIRTSSYPDTSGALGGEGGTFLLKYPSDFQIKIIGGSDLVLLNTVQCACTSFQVNYDTEGNVYTHIDGTPVSTTITISLQETKQLTKTTINELYK
jgi:putative lipoic acid-binding regulatory protein